MLFAFLLALIVSALSMVTSGSSAIAGASIGCCCHLCCAECEFNVRLDEALAVLVGGVYLFFFACNLTIRMWILFLVDCVWIPE